MICAAKISSNLNYISNVNVNKIEKHLKKAGLPINNKHLDSKKLLKFILRDKKNKRNYIKFILLRNIGNAFISKDFNIKQFKKIIKNLHDY